MNAIRQANTVLHRLTFQRRNIETQQRADRVSIPNFKNINERAKGFYSAIGSGWTCPCQADHNISLRLEPRMEDASSDDDDDEVSMRDPFHVLFQYSHLHSATTNANMSPWTWDEADIHVTCERPKPTTTTAASNIRGEKGVRFASQAKRAVQAALDPEPNLEPIKDLCSAICTLQKPERYVCLKLLEKEIAKQKYGLLIYPTKTLPCDTELWSVSTLRSALQRGRRFSKRDRVRLAVTLASSVLHRQHLLCGTAGHDHI
jgi:hypothetical protein